MTKNQTRISKKTKQQFAVYLAVAYVLAYLIERASANSGDSTLFQSPAWPIVFILWYGFLFSVAYLIFRKRPLWLILIVGGLIGPVIELVLFRKSFLISDLGYGIMLVVPFFFARILVKDELSQ